MRHKYFFFAICKVFKQKLKPFVGFFASLGGVAWRHVPISDENNTEMGSLAGMKKLQGHWKGLPQFTQCDNISLKSCENFWFSVTFVFCNEK